MQTSHSYCNRDWNLSATEKIEANMDEHHNVEHDINVLRPHFSG